MRRQSSTSLPSTLTYHQAPCPFMTPASSFAFLLRSVKCFSALPPTFSPMLSHLSSRVHLRTGFLHSCTFIATVIGLFCTSNRYLSVGCFPTQRMATRYRGKSHPLEHQTHLHHYTLFVLIFAHGGVRAPIRSVVHSQSRRVVAKKCV